jgi:hypothetical protein
LIGVEDGRGARLRDRLLQPPPGRSRWSAWWIPATQT